MNLSMRSLSRNLPRSPKLFPVLSCALAMAWVVNVLRQRPGFNPLTATLADVSRLLDEGSLTSVDLVNAYIGQVEKHNKNGARLNAVLSLVPEQTVLESARKSDQERAAGKPRSRLHGIPFLVKDNLWTDKSFGLPVTCGALAFKNTFAKQNAYIIQTLLDAGMILLGTANLSELANAKSTQVWGGWSTLGGQTQSPYVDGGIDPTDTPLGHSCPAGSSSGSAVAVAAGMAPIAVGTECDGSIMMPADRASIFSIRLSPTPTLTSGLLRYNSLGDSVGWMVKGAEDAALMLNVALGNDDYTKYLGQSFKGLRIGLLDPMKWQPGTAIVRPNDEYNEQFMSEFNAMASKLESAGAIIHRDIDLRRWTGEDQDMWRALTYHDYGHGFVEFTDGLIDPTVRTMSDLIDFNKKHAEQAMPPDNPGQDILEKTVANMNSLSTEQYEEYQSTILNHTRDIGVDAAMKRYDIDVIMGAPTGRSATIYDAGGYPVGTLPLGYAKFNGRAFGLSFVVPRGREDLQVRVMSAWEKLLNPRKPPPKL
ncbi:amidase signature domain-containing protein [Xylaria bambusicola]|uniref:amidase signature domain-containing protein n=1 Tax=Xylaria bambusicola TaxID=326684 RepID=UPI00200753E5|nr:amidase signature domain-containing protein [Xylaria bambusicola]KAI0521431.1 amidase signature domain-containing protein [Xylaria bambusicola]